MTYFIYYCEVNDSKKDGLKVSGPFKGGTAPTKSVAGKVAKELINGSPNQIIVIPKIFNTKTEEEAEEVANKSFDLMIEQMQASMEIIERRKKKKKKKK